jgi:hypothetical protein
MVESISQQNILIPLARTEKCQIALELKSHMSISQCNHTLFQLLREGLGVSH